MFVIYVLIFLICCGLLYFSGEWVIGGLMRIARFFALKEFVVAFFIMAFAASLPNLFVGILSALNKIPELSFGDIVGGNVVDLTLAIGLAGFFARAGLSAESRTVQTTSIFTIIAAILPLALILDRYLSRIDGILLLILFVIYNWWLFSKKERFAKIYNHEVAALKEVKAFFKDLGKAIIGTVLLIIAAYGIVKSAGFFAFSLGASLGLIGVLIVGVGNALPETYFAVVSAKKGETWMILGDLMGAVIVAATLVLGIVALICPIRITDFSPFAVGRFFLIISALFFFLFVRTGRKITKSEAVLLFLLYVAFFITEIIVK
jgi:cation:H+ antiporter